MIGGHFAAAPILKKYYPNVPSFVFTFGVIYIDILFACFSLFGHEGFSADRNNSILGVTVHCDYSHNLVSAVAWSLLYGKLTGHLVPGSIAAFSHFVLDWVVHCDDLLLDPISKTVVGGTNLWGSNHALALALEHSFCLFSMYLTSENTHLMIPSAICILVNIVGFPQFPRLFNGLLSLEPIYSQIGIFFVVSILFLVPAVAFAYIMDSKKVKSA